MITQPTSDARSHYYHEFGDVAIGAASVFSSAVEQIGFLPEYTTVTWLPRGPANEDARDRDKRLSAVAYHDILEQEADDARSSPQVREMRPIFGAAPATIDPKLCFVLMPFDPELREVYDDYIAPSASAANLIAARADDIFSNRPIMQDIWEHICRARIIVADLTKRNPNVFYEVGIAHTLGKEVILVAQSLDDVPFDLRSHRIIMYETTPRAMREFSEKLITTIQSILSPPQNVSMH